MTGGGYPVFSVLGTVTSGVTPVTSEWSCPDPGGNLDYQFTPTETVAAFAGTLTVEMTLSPDRVPDASKKLTTYAPTGFTIPAIAGTMAPILLKLTNLSRRGRFRLRFVPSSGTGNIYADVGT